MTDYTISDSAYSLDLSLIRGDSWSKQFTVVQEAVAVALTGSSIYFTIRKVDERTDLDDNSAKYTQTITSFTGDDDNIFTLSISAADSIIFENISYVYDISWKDTSDNIKTLFSGRFDITDTSTNRDIK